MVRDWLLQEALPVLVEVAPEQIAGEADDRQPSFGLHGEGEAGVQKRLADSTDDLVDVDSALAASAGRAHRQLVQSRHHETEFDPQLIHERQVERQPGGFVGDDLVGLDDAIELDRSEQ